MLRSPFNELRRLALVVTSAACISALNAGIASAQTIYDSQVLTRMQFTDSQRAEVEKVVEQSGETMTRIFEKYGIDPEAKPNFDKLREARHELQELEASEKRKMKAIMSRKQFKYYLGLIQQTAANVIRATRNKP